MPRTHLRRRALRLLPPIVTRHLEHDYYADRSQGLSGKKDPHGRVQALLPLAELARDQAVLDLGCAEGLMLQPFLAQGARFVHGVDDNLRRIHSARRRFEPERSRFDLVDLNRPDLLRERSTFLASYDIVLFLGIYQHLRRRIRDRTLAIALSMAAKWFAFRSPRPLLDEGLRLIEECGFSVDHVVSGGGDGALATCRRLTGPTALLPPRD